MARHASPNTVLFGYLEGVDRRDAEAYARGFARRTHNGRVEHEVDGVEHDIRHIGRLARLV